MNAFFKTLFGDWATLSFVAVIIAVELGIVRTGYATAADIAVPFLIMGGVSWLATR